MIQFITRRGEVPENFMSNPLEVSSDTSLEMANETFYRNQANSYRKSEEYSQMVRLYPVLKHSIGECKNESFVA